MEIYVEMANEIKVQSKDWWREWRKNKDKETKERVKENETSINLKTWRSAEEKWKTLWKEE